MGGQNLRNAPPMERSAPPKEWKLPPEFILPWEPGVPEEPRPGAEAAPESGAPAGLADTGLRRHGPSVDSSGRRPGSGAPLS